MEYKDSDYDSFIQTLADKKPSKLILFIGLFDPDKRKALNEISRTLDKDVKRFDFNEIVSKIETETFEAIDSLFGEVNSSSDPLYFSNGDKLCGAYTGFTHSKIKYATPQERYFLKKVAAYEGIIIVDITETDSADETILRAADTIVKFPLPKSRFRRILWHLKNYSLHGFDIKTKRPEGYSETAANI